MSDIFLNCCKRVHTANRLNDCYMLCTCVAPAFLSKWIEDLFSEITSADSNLLVGSRPKVKLPIPKASQSAYNRVQRISYGRIDTKNSNSNTLIESIHTLNAQVHFEKYTEVRQIKESLYVCMLLLPTIKGRTCNKQLEKKESLSLVLRWYVNTNATYSQQKRKKKLRLAAFIIKIDYHGICSQAIFLRHENMWAHSLQWAFGVCVCVCIYLFSLFNFMVLQPVLGRNHLSIRFVRCLG